MLKKLLLIIAIGVMWTSPLRAQNINVTSVDSSRWPEVRLTGALPAGPHSPEHYTLQVGPGAPVTAAAITGPLPNDPASLVVAVDTSHSLTPDQLRAAKEALGRYVDRLDPGEQVALLGFNDMVQLATGFTGDRREIKRNLDSLQLGGVRTELYRSMLYGLELVKNMPGRHHLLVLSDGHDEGSNVTFDQVLLLALDNNIKISAVGLPGTRATGGGQRLAILRDLATRTGGQYREAHSPEELKTGLASLLEQYQEQARQERDRLYELTFIMPGPAPRIALPANLERTAEGSTQTAFFRLSRPPADLVALASGEAFPRSGRRAGDSDKSKMAASAESAAASALAAAGGSAAPAGGGAGGSVLANSAAGSLAGPAAMTVPGAAAASTVPAPASGTASFWLNPALWLLLASLLLALGIYYWWKSRQEEEYEEEEAAENLDDIGREPAVDIDRAFVFDPGPVTAPLGGMSLPRPLSPFALVFPQTGRKISLPNGVMSIGSAPDNHIVLEGAEVAPNQVEIYVTNGECDIIVMDAGGRVRLNGRPLTALRTALKPDDELVIGRTRALLKRNAALAYREKYREYQRQTAKNSRPESN